MIPLRSDISPSPSGLRYVASAVVAHIEANCVFWSEDEIDEKVLEWFWLRSQARLFHRRRLERLAKAVMTVLNAESDRRPLAPMRRKAAA